MHAFLYVKNDGDLTEDQVVFIRKKSIKRLFEIKIT
jgi:hypothetical protein